MKSKQIFVFAEKKNPETLDFKGEKGKNYSKGQKQCLLLCHHHGNMEEASAKRHWQEVLQT